MIKYDPIVVEGRDFIHAWSDEGRYVVSDETGVPYTDAYDPAGLGRTYHEGDLIPVEPEEPENGTAVEDAQTQEASQPEGNGNEE